MTFGEAITQIDRALEALQLRDSTGELLGALFSGGVVARYFPEEHTALLEAFEQKKIDVDAYCAGMLAMVRRFGLQRFQAQVMSKFSDLQLDQAELDLVPTKGRTG